MYSLILAVGFIGLSIVLFTRYFEVVLDRSVKQRAGMSQVSPLITKMQWGSISIERMDENGMKIPNSEVSYRDAKLWPGGSRAWDWRETGTGHVPGIQTKDVDELLEHNPETVVLSRGVLRVLQVPQNTVDYIQKQRPSTQVLVHPSKKAFEVYNELASKGARVAALIHTTC